jgi:acetylornithine deacetylase/succinyl-diaminopimelate desuccinylase-like protein
MSAAAANQRIAALAAERHVHRAFSWMRLHEPLLRRWQLEFLRIPAPPFGEAARAEWFCERFRELGLSNVHLDAEGNALAELPAPIHAEHSPLSTTSPHAEPSTLGPEPSSRPVVLLSAHLDTVFPAATPCIPREELDRIYCPGACDNGAGLAALLGLAAGLREAELQPACTVLFAANVGEEGEGDLRGMRHLFSAPPYAGRIRAALALEGAGAATLVDRALGSRRLRLEITGPGGHSWADAGMPNPIVALANGLAALSQIELPQTPRTTLNCGTIAGGTSVNSIPAHATADLDLRSTSMRELDRLERIVLAELSAAVRTEAQRGHAAGALRLPQLRIPQLRIQVRRIGDRAAGELAASSPLGRAVRAVDRHLGMRTELRVGSTDANLPLSLGIPALAIGAGGLGGGIHTTGEWYEPAGRELALRRVLLLLLDACGMAARDELIDAVS